MIRKINIYINENLHISIPIITFSIAFLLFVLLEACSNNYFVVGEKYIISYKSTDPFYITKTDTIIITDKKDDFIQYHSIKDDFLCSRRCISLYFNTIKQ